MSAINLAYNSDSVYSEIVDNEIILKSKEGGELVYKFPLPKNFQIVETNYFYGDNYPSYIMTPYQLHKPNYIPTGYKNLKIGVDGLYHVDNGKVSMAYIDTTILTEKNFEYSTLGKFKVNNDGIPNPFWCTLARDCYKGWQRPDNILKTVKDFDKNARLIYEEELISIFALNDFGFEFWEHLPEDIYEESFFKDTSKYFLCVQDFWFDNWDIVVSSRENRNIYRKVFREKVRLCYEHFWYRNTSFTNNDTEKSDFYIFPVLDDKKSSKEESGPRLVKERFSDKK